SPRLHADRLPLRSRAGRQQRQGRLEAHRVPRRFLLQASLRLLRRPLRRGQVMSGVTPPQRHYKLTDAVDFVIIGAGASGGVLARELSRNGFSVVVLEKVRGSPPRTLLTTST